MPVKNDRILEMRQEIAPVGPSSLSPPASIRGKGPVVIKGRARLLTEALFSLEEPWQSRFLNLVANLATKWSWDGQQPTREEIAGWLNADSDLYQEIKLLLDAWRRPAR
jgi:hypothetical protein